MNQLSLFTKNALRTKLISTEDLSLESIAKMDEIQIYELGVSIFQMMEFWIECLGKMDINSANITPYKTALLDISDLWFKKMTQMLQQIDTGNIFCKKLPSINSSPKGPLILINSMLFDFNPKISAP